MAEIEITPEIKAFVALKHLQMVILQQNIRIARLEKIIADFVLESYRTKSVSMEDMLGLD